MKTLKTLLVSFTIFLTSCGSKLPPFENCVVRCTRCAEGAAFEDLVLSDIELFCTDRAGNPIQKDLSDLHLNACVPLDQLTDVISYCRQLGS